MNGAQQSTCLAVPLLRGFCALLEWGWRKEGATTSAVQVFCSAAGMPCMARHVEVNATLGTHSDVGVNTCIVLSWGLFVSGPPKVPNSLKMLRC